jgi:hypothetical protein
MANATKNRRPVKKGGTAFKTRRDQSPVNLTARQLILAAVSMGETLLRERLVPLAGKLVPDGRETRDVSFEEQHNVSIRRPRAWLQTLLNRVATTYQVTIEPVERGKNAFLRITGPWTNVAMAEITVRKLIVNVNRLADAEYTTAFQAAVKRGKPKQARGTRKAWIDEFVKNLETAFDATDRLRTEFGEERVASLTRPERRQTDRRAQAPVLTGATEPDGA